ncbi:MAG: hypothetical protein AMXMBFR58_23860 [Phycisphaerae bacterium]
MNAQGSRALLVALLAVAGLAAAITTTQSTAQPASRASIKAADGTFKPESLPIRRITLYRSGVGSFERRGVIDGDATIQLRFDTDQVNDILKSMVVVDMGGGEINGVSYASKEPLAKRLASFGVDISGNPSVKDLLSQLRGSKATISTPEGQVTGTILGTETRPEAQGQANNPIDIPYLNLLTPNGIKSINYRLITNVVLEDKSLNDELMMALAALAEHRADRTKAVDVSFSGHGARDVAIAYINEMPVWKTSYRLILPDARKQEGLSKDQGSPTLQGWAIVENTTDEDWKDVTLSLVSGRPVSFMMDLYEPLFVARPDVPVPTIPGVAPRIYAESSIATNALKEIAGRVAADKSEQFDRSAPKPATASLGKARREIESRAAGAGTEMRDAAEEPQLDSAAMANYAARAQAQAVESGEVFQYQLERPVTVERQRSAMLPILSTAIESRRVSIYNRADGSQYPMRGVELKNSSPLQLMPGPISVFDSGAYAGDAQIGHVAPGEKRLLAYSVDLDVNAVAKDEGTSTIQKIRIVKGTIEQIIRQVTTTGYAFRNKDKARERTIIVEHPRLDGWKLIEGKDAPTPADKTERFYRFEITVAPEKEGSLSISQEQTTLHSAGVFDFDLNWLMEQQRKGKLSEAALNAIREAGRLRGLVEDSNRRIARLEQERNEITQDQARMRENLKTVDKSSQLYTRMMTKLSDSETRLDTLAEELESARAEAQKRQQDLDAYIGSLDVE